MTGKKIVLLASLILALAGFACGGGGGGGGGQGPQVPSAPTGLVADPGDGQCSLTWNSVNGATGYTVYYSTQSGTGTGGTAVQSADNNETIPGLANGTTYYFVVTASNQAGESAPSAEVSCTPAPEQPGLSISGRVVFDDQTPVAGAQVFGSTRSLADFTLRQGSQMNSATTDDQGNFTLELGPTDLPVKVLVEVSWQQSGLPVVENAKWATAESGTVDMGTIMLPNPQNAELTISGGSAQNADGSLKVDNLPGEIDRLFGKSFDPDQTPEAFPGEFAESGLIPLNSSVFIWMEALDANGNPVTDLSQAVTIRSIIPPNQWPDLEDIESGTDRIEIPIYVYNETTDLWEQMGTGWLEDGQGTILPEDAQSVILDGSFGGQIYAVFEANHFSWMNVDYSYIGPWTLSRINRNFRNNDCLYNALQLAKKIALSDKGRAAYAKVNQPGADITTELADRMGPELKTFAPSKDQLYGEYRGDAGGKEDEIYINQKLWDLCGEGATQQDKKVATWMLTLTILHETAHWKDDVKKFPKGPDGKEPKVHDTDDEEGWQLELDLIGKTLFVNYNDKKIHVGSTTGPELPQSELDNWLNPDTWTSTAGGGGGGSSLFAGEFRSGSQAEPSPLQVTISLAQNSFNLGDDIIVTVEYENISDQPIEVLNFIELENYPIYFVITNTDTAEAVGYLGPELRLGWSGDDFATLNPGETLTKQVNIVKDDQGNFNRYNLRVPGNYQMYAVYGGFFGLPKTQSNTVSFTLGEGGTVSGNVTDASTGNPIEGAEIKAFLNGNLMDTAFTDANGDYTMANLIPGTYTIEARASGYLRSVQENVNVAAEQTTTVNFSLSPLLAAGQIRIVLTWGEQPEDLDSHLWLPDNTPYHVYYGNVGSADSCPFAFLDVDDTDSFGPETITINQLYPGTYLYAVKNFSGSPGFDVSEAQVQVFDSTGLIATFNVPTNNSTDEWWKVLEIDGTTGSITEINEIVADDPSPYSNELNGCIAP